MDTETMVDLVRAHMGSVSVPTAYDKVFKDECMFTFDTPEAPGGLYVNLKTFQAFSAQYVDLDHERTSQVLYLHEKWHRVPLSAEEKEAAASKPDKLAVGGAGGFQVDAPDYKVEKEHTLAIMPARLTVPLPCPELPERVLQAITAIMAHESANVQDTVAAWEEERKVSKYAANLPQLETGRRVPPDPKMWKCEETGESNNLWLNLSTGFIGSGREHWDGSGGNGSALRHFEATGKKYPLVVKLGTITPHGADVYSYAEDEDDMVEDPHLAQHLAHWGINMMACEKTEKSMAELQIDLNASFEFDRITEAGSALTPLAGPGYVGLTNLGNSCYMNSVLQVLWTLPELRARYVDVADQVFRSAPQECQSDLPTQMAKLGVALLTGRTGAPPSPPEEHVGGGDTPMADANGGGPPATLSVKPTCFKTLVGRGHPEFSTARQQDAVEYVQHLLELLARAEHAAAGRLGPPPAGAAATPDVFRFELENRVACSGSGRVSYKRESGNSLGLEIPLEAATNTRELEAYKEREQKRARLKEANADVYIGQDSQADAVVSTEKEEPVIPQVPFAACLSRFAGDEAMDDYYSAALRRRGPATKRTRLATFPPYLLVQMRRYYVAQDWTPKKMEVAVEVPEVLDIEYLRGRGPQPDEQLQPEEPEAPPAAAAPRAAAPEPDVAIVSALTAMGFSENGAKRAALAVGNSSAEAASEWVFAHMEDADFNEPLPDPAAAATAEDAGGNRGGAAEPSPEALAMLLPMGFNERQAAAALRATGGSVERAGDWLFSHMDDLDAAVAQAEGGGGGGGGAGAAAGAAAAAAPALNDGPGKYELLGFVSHMGTNTACGHYVAHIKKEGRWVIYNDEKVAVSEHPPKQLGYMYLYKRRDV